MLLGLSDDQQFFRETTARFLTEQAPPDAVRALRNDATGFDPSYWRRGAELGWTSLLVDEEHGGGTISGAGLVDLGLVAYEFGRHAAPGPLVTTNVVASTLGAHGAAPDVLGSLLSGEGIATWCAPAAGPDGWRPTVEASHEGPDLVLRGEARPVESAGAAGHLLVSCRDDGGATQVLVPASAAGVTVSPLQTVDLTRRFSIVTFDEVRVPADAVVGAAGEASADIDRQFQVFLVIAERGVGRGHADRIRHDGRVGLRPLFLRAASRLVSSPEAPVRRHDELARGIPRHQRGGLRRHAGGPRRSARAGQRGQGLHRPVRSRAAPGLRAAPRGDRGHVRARPAPVPAPPHRRPCAGRYAGGPPAAHRRCTDEGVAA